MVYLQINYAEYFFIVAFIIESAIKIVAYGFILNKHSYLRELWNWFDFVNVLVSSIQLFLPFLTNVTFL